MAIPILPIISILSNIAPTIAQGLMMKGTLADKAMGILSKFADKLGMPENEDMAFYLKKLELEQIMELKRLDLEFKLELERYRFEIDKVVITGQTDLLKSDSRSISWARKWWRPFIAWTCGLTLSIFYLYPLIAHEIFRLLVATGVVEASTFDTWRHSAPLLDIATILGLIVPLLGLGAYRTFEKYTGTTEKP